MQGHIWKTLKWCLLKYWPWRPLLSSVYNFSSHAIRFRCIFTDTMFVVFKFCSRFLKICFIGSEITVLHLVRLINGVWKKQGCVMPIWYNFAQDYDCDIPMWNHLVPKILRQKHNQQVAITNQHTDLKAFKERQCFTCSYTWRRIKADQQRSPERRHYVVFMIPPSRNHNEKIPTMTQSATLIPNHIWTNSVIKKHVSYLFVVR